MKKIIALLIFGWVQFTYSNLLAVSTDYSKIDQHARQAPAKLKNNLPKLTSYLIKPAKNDSERVRSFYVWISENIAYDVQLFRNYNPSRYKQSSPAEVLQRGKAVCQSYAELFQEMCRLANISSHVVPGYSKGFNYTPKSKFTNADHAWNVVKLDGKWHLVDVAWGSGGLDNKMKNSKLFNEEYFLTSPEDFVVN
ncbi:MAG: transglutaminase domain-containing protein, partial [Cyclobacteriaceae bacterium]